MSSTTIIEDAEFQNPPLRDLLLIIFHHFKALYIKPPTSLKIENTFLADMAQQAGESYETKLENYNMGLKRLNSKENSNWMEKSFDEALRLRNDKWGPTGYIKNEMQSPPANPKRKYSDMITSDLRVNQDGDFLLPSAKVEEEEEEEEDEEEEEEDEERRRTRRRRRKMRMRRGTGRTRRRLKARMLR